MNTRGMSHTLFGEPVQVEKSSYRLEIRLANYATSNMMCSLAMNLKNWKYQKGGKLLRV